MPKNNTFIQYSYVTQNISYYTMETNFEATLGRVSWTLLTDMFGPSTVIRAYAANL